MELFLVKYLNNVPKKEKGSYSFVNLSRLQSLALCLLGI